MNLNTVVILSGLLTIVGNTILLPNIFKQHTDLKSQQQSAQTELDRAHQQVNHLSQLREQSVIANATLSNIEREFPAQENLGTLISSIENTAAASHISIEAINRQVTDSPVPGFSQVNLNVLMRGNYPSTVRFLKWLKDEKRLLNVTGYDSTSDGKQNVNVTGYVRTSPSTGAQP